MPSPIEKIAIIGTGVIGSGWTLRLLAKKKEIYVFEPSIKQKKFLFHKKFKKNRSFKSCLYFNETKSAI